MQKLFENWRGYLKEERGPCDGLLQLAYDKIIFVVDRFAIKDEEEFRRKVYGLSEYITNPTHGEGTKKRPTIEIVTFKKKKNGWLFYDRLGPSDRMGRHLCAKSVKQGKLSFKPNTGMIKIITEDVLTSHGKPPWKNLCFNVRPEILLPKVEIVVPRHGAIKALNSQEVGEMIISYFEESHSRVLDCQRGKR
jgi:hypothetical protein